MTWPTDFVPAEVFPLAEFLSDEILARGWTTTDVALRMGGTDEEIARNLLVVDLVMCVHRDGLLMSDKTFADLARAFEIEEHVLRSLDEAWRKWPDQRSEFTPPEAIFGPISRRALIRAVQQTPGA